MMQWQAKQEPDDSVTEPSIVSIVVWAESSTELLLADYRFKKLSLVKQIKVNAQQMATQTSRMTTIQPSIPRLQAPQTSRHSRDSSSLSHLISACCMTGPFSTNAMQCQQFQDCG